MQMTSESKSAKIIYKKEFPIIEDHYHNAKTQAQKDPEDYASASDLVSVLSLRQKVLAEIKATFESNAEIDSDEPPDYYSEIKGRPFPSYTSYPSPVHTPEQEVRYPC